MTDPDALQLDSECIWWIADAMKRLTPEGQARVAQYIAQAYGTAAAAARTGARQTQTPHYAAALWGLALRLGPIGHAEVESEMMVSRSTADQRLARAVDCGALVRVERGVYEAVPDWAGAPKPEGGSE